MNHWLDATQVRPLAPGEDSAVEFMSNFLQVRPTAAKGNGVLVGGDSNYIRVVSIMGIFFRFVLCARRLCVAKCRFQVAFDGVVLDLPRRCDEEPLNSDCQINASLRSSSISFSVQSLVGRAWRNIMTSWKSILSNLSDHLTRNATQT